MNYHNITKDDMLNGDGLRVVLWVAGCDHHCKGCQNPVTWDPKGGILFDHDAYLEINKELDKDYVDGITLSGGDPLYSGNLLAVVKLLEGIKKFYPGKTIWLYTGYTWEEIMDIEKPDLAQSTRRYIIEKLVDVLVDGRYEEELRDVTYPWAGSINQRVIDVKESLKQHCCVMWNND